MLPSLSSRSASLLAATLLVTGSSQAQLRWVEVQPTNAPAARYGHATMFATPLYQNILFGGTDGQQVFGDTWLWDDVEWHVLAQQGPPARYDHTLARNHFEDDTLLLFGGRDLEGTIFGDSWMWDGQAWMDLGFGAGEAPSPRFGHAMTKEEWSIRKLYLFGGETAAGFSQETWVFEEGVWSIVPAATLPPARAGHVLHQDRFDQHLILHGGYNEDGVLQDTWKFDGQDWYQVSDSGQAAAGHSMEYYSQFGRQRHAVVGGMVGSPDFMEWSNRSGRWFGHETLGGMPFRTESSAFAGWAGGQYPLFVFGGLDAQGQALGDMWTLQSDLVAQTNSLGFGCGSGPWGEGGPFLFTQGSPLLGETLDLFVTAAGAPEPIVVGVGSQRIAPPFSSSFTCGPRIDFEQLFLAKIDWVTDDGSLTTASAQLAIPFDMSLHGTTWLTQVVAPDPNPLRRKAVSEVIELFLAL